MISNFFLKVVDFNKDISYYYKASLRYNSNNEAKKRILKSY